MLRSDPEFENRLIEYNRQRVKSLNEIAHEFAIDISPEGAYRSLIEQRKAESAVSGDFLVVGGKKARMADPAAAERATGYVTGGISPLGQRRVLPAVLDATAEDFDTILVSAGQRGLEIELAPADLVRAANAVVAPIARPK